MKNLNGALMHHMIGVDLQEIFTMARRLSVKRRKMAADKARAHNDGTAPKPHKVAVERSAKMKKKMAYRA